MGPPWSPGGGGAEGSAALDAAQDRPEPRHQLSRRAGLGDVVIRSQLQADDPVDVVALGREHENRDAALPADAPERLDAAQARQHDVQDHDRIASRQRFRGAAVSIVDSGRLEALLLEILAEHLAQLDVVINQEHSRHRSRIHYYVAMIPLVSRLAPRFGPPLHNFARGNQR
jgi:hypothetical protein